MLHLRQQQQQKRKSLPLLPPPYLIFLKQAVLRPELSPHFLGVSFVSSSVWVEDVVEGAGAGRTSQWTGPALATASSAPLQMQPLFSQRQQQAQG